jgi:hypothetical protein
LARGAFTFAGFLLFCQTIGGLFLMAGGGSRSEPVDALRWLLWWGPGFPIFLAGWWSLRQPLRWLWLFFAAQWIYSWFMNWSVRGSFAIVSPLKFPALVTAVSSTLVYLGHTWLVKALGANRPLGLRDAM